MLLKKPWYWAKLDFKNNMFTKLYHFSRLYIRLDRFEKSNLNQTFV